MSFFEELPPQPVEEKRYVEPDWRRVPREYVPTPLALSRLVHRSADAALVLQDVSVYPSGFTFTLTATRHPEASPADPPMHEMLLGGPPGRAGERVRLGLLFDDGRRAAFPVDYSDHTHRTGPPVAAISSRGGGGSSDSASAELFVWPIPATGDLTLLFRWTSQGLDETRVVLSGDDLRGAAAAATEIWPGAQVPPASSDGW